MKSAAIAVQEIALLTAPAQAELAASVVEASALLVARPPEPASEVARFDDLCANQGDRDGLAAAELLDMPHDRPDGAYGQLQCYAVAVVILANYLQQRIKLDGRERLQRVIRQQIRVELARQWFRAATVWLIPATTEERTAAHVGALLLSRSGIAARPWLWAGLPEHGSFSLLGDPAGEPLPASHPALSHHRCSGITHFMQLI